MASERPETAAPAEPTSHVHEGVLAVEFVPVSKHMQFSFDMSCDIS
jgi:hypothetical protein